MHLFACFCEEDDDIRLKSVVQFIRNRNHADRASGLNAPDNRQDICGELVRFSDEHLSNVDGSRREAREWTRARHDEIASRGDAGVAM